MTYRFLEKQDAERIFELIDETPEEDNEKSKEMNLREEDTSKDLIENKHYKAKKFDENERVVVKLNGTACDFAGNSSDEISDSKETDSFIEFGINFPKNYFNCSTKSERIILTFMLMYAIT